MERRFTFSIDTADSCELFELHLERKPVRLGPVEFEQWWMPLPRLYKSVQRVNPDPNFETVLRLFWANVQEHGFTQDRQQQEKYLLASLAPMIRTIGSRRIFADASLDKEKWNLERSIQQALSETPPTSIAEEDFARACWAYLGCSPLPEETIELKTKMTAELLNGACQRLEQGDIRGAREDVVATWQSWKSGIGRRGRGWKSGAAEPSSNPVANRLTVLDVLSYEMRAAFHHVYSNAWMCLIDCARKKNEMSDDAAHFHEWWHTAPYNQETDIAIFAGHVFALHPACGSFLHTPAGAALMGGRLSNPTDTAAEGAFYGGLSVALSQYAEIRQDANSNRRDRGFRNRQANQFSNVRRRYGA